ncbi:MAG: tetratricopeptide repeat protein [Chloroflexota bacterium]|mgnify:FL=1
MLESHLTAADALIQGRYQVLGQIGHGGMGTVYEALDTRLGAVVALKWLRPPPGADELQMRVLLRAFEREAKILARLRHPALPGVSDYFGDTDGQWLVMQHIPGCNLAELLARRGAPFPLAQVLGWADVLLDALEYLHSRRPPVLHRDIKPQNLKLTPAGELVLLDFGLARGGEEQTRAVGGPSLLAYTPQYSPIEQIRGEAPDPRSDLYALGATLYHLLTNQLPANAVARMQAVLDGKPDPLRPAHELNPELPPGLGRALQHAMALLPEQRPVSAAAMRSLLSAYNPERSGPGAGAIAGAPDADQTQASPAGPQAERQKRWRRLLAGLLAAVALAGAVALGEVGGRQAPADEQGEAVPAAPVSTLGQAALSRPPSVTPREDAAGPIGRGQALAGAGEGAPALPGEAVPAAPHVAAAYAARGDAHARTGNRTLALEDYTRAITIDPAHARAYLGRALVAFAQREYELAIADYDRYLALEPEGAAGYYNRALAHLARGDAPAALADYDRYLALQPLDADGFLGRGRVYAALGDLQHALDDFDRALQLQPEHAPALYERGAARLQAGQHEGAVADLRACIQLTTDPELRRNAEELLSGIEPLQ